MDDKKILELDIADAILDRPNGFSVGHRHFYLWPVTLGKIYLSQRLTDQMEINEANLRINPFAEALRLVEAKREDCALLLAYHTLKTKEEVNNHRTVTIRKNLFMKELSSEDMATLLIACLTWDKTERFVKHMGIAKEQERMNRVQRIKNDKNTYNFGGKTIYGSIIDTACERYGWTFDYVVWEISYTNLQLMLKDSVKSIYLTDDELKRCHVPKDGYTLDGNDPDTVKDVISSGSWK